MSTFSTPEPGAERTPGQRGLDRECPRTGAEAGVRRSPVPVDVRRAGNLATARMLGRVRRSSTAMLARAGDPQGLMKEHTAANMTHHHVIPENRIHDFWAVLDANNLMAAYIANPAIPT